MKGAVTVSATLPRFKRTSSAPNVRIVNNNSAVARRINAAFAVIRFLISTTAGRLVSIAS